MSADYKDNFDDEKYRKYVARVSKISKVIGFFLSFALIASIVVVSVENFNLKYWGIPKWIRTTNSAICTGISSLLVIIMIYVFRTYEKFLQGQIRREMQNTKIRKFFVIFTFSYVYLTMIQIISAIKNWKIKGNPLEYPFLIQMADFSIMILYDIICIS